MIKIAASIFMACLICGHSARSESTIETPSTHEAALVQWLPRAHAGDANAQFVMGHLWEEGLTAETPRNLYQAGLWYIYAARQGHTPAMVALGVLQWNDGQKEPALQWFSLAAQRGNQNALDLLTQMGQPVQDIESVLASQAYQSYRSSLLSGGRWWTWWAIFTRGTAIALFPW